jgi:hypothetical protein
MTIQKGISKGEEFSHRLDFYWQYIGVYAIVLLIYSLFRGTIEEGTFTLKVRDPIVILLVVFIVGSAIPLLISYYKQNKIIIGIDYIIFKTRFREKKYMLNEIQRINLGKERLFKMRRGAMRVVKIKLKNRIRVIRIRPSSYWNEEELLQSLIRLKKALPK